jgi:hypothetical protein
MRLAQNHRLSVVGIIDKRVFIVDVPQMKVLKTIEMPSPPQEDLMRPEGKEVYVSCHVDNGADKIVFIRTSDWTIDHTVDTGYFPDGLAWTSLSAKSLHPGQ